MQIINELTEFIDRLDNGRMKKIFSLPYFNKVYMRYFANKKDIDFQELIDVYKEIGIIKNDLITLTKLSDFLNHNNKLYRLINKENNFGISLRFNSTYEKREGKGINNYLAIESNYINIEKIIEQELKQYMNIEKIGEREYLISEIQKVHNFKIESQEISNYIRKNGEKIIIRGQEEDLDKFVDIIYAIPDNFSETSEKFLLMDGLSLVMSIISPEMKNIKIKYIIDDNNIIEYLKSLGISKVGQLKKIDYIKIEINILRFISETILNTNFKCPKSYQDEIGQSLQQSLSEKYYKIAKLIYLNNMKYTEVAVKFGITRSGAQSAGEKIKKKLFNIDNSIFNNFFKQTMLFRDNDYYFSQEIFEKVNVSENLFCSIFGMIKYRDSNLYVLDNIINQISISNEQRVYLFDEKNYKEESFEFDFIKSLPNIIRKCDIGKTIEIIKTNLSGDIDEKSIRNLLYISYLDYHTVLSKNKLTLEYFLRYVLEYYYPNGVDVYDENELNKIRQLIQELFNFSFGDKNNRYLSTRICKISTLVGRGIWKYNSNISLPDEVLDKISDFVECYPISTVPIRAIYEKFSAELIEYGINNRYAFQGTLKKSALGEWKVTKDYLYTEDDSQSFFELISDYIKNSKTLVSKEVLEEKFPGFQLGMMQKIINTTSIVNMNGYYIAMENLGIEKYEIVSLKKDLEEVISDNQIHNFKNIYYRFKNKHNGMFNRVGINHYLQLYYIANKLFDDDFEFERPLIAKKGIEIQDMETQLVDKVVEMGCVEIKELGNISRKIGFMVDSIMDFVIRNNDEIMFKDENEIISIKKMDLDEEKLQQIDNILDRFIVYSDYRNLSDLSKEEEILDLYSMANNWLLYSIISTYSTKYKIYRTNNMMSRAELFLVRDNFDTSKIDFEKSQKNMDIDLDINDLLDIDDLED